MKRSSYVPFSGPGTSPSSPREVLIRKLALSATTRPLDREAIEKARNEVLETLGPEALVEASGVVGFFECFTKFVDATGKKANSSVLHNVLTLGLGAQTWIYNVVSWFY